MSACCDSHAKYDKLEDRQYLTTKQRMCRRATLQRGTVYTALLCFSLCSTLKIFFSQTQCALFFALRHTVFRSGPLWESLCARSSNLFFAALFFTLQHTDPSLRFLQSFHVLKSKKGCKKPFLEKASRAHRAVQRVCPEGLWSFVKCVA